MLEYTYVWHFHPSEASIECIFQSPVTKDSSLAFLLLNDEYKIALAVSITEYLVELYFFPSWKNSTILFYLGGIAAIVFQCVR